MLLARPTVLRKENKKRTKLAPEPDDDDDWQGDDDDWISSDADPLPHLDSGSDDDDDDDIAVPGLGDSSDDTPETTKQKREKSLKSTM